MKKQPVCEHFELLPRRKLCNHCYNLKEDHIFVDEDISDLKEILHDIASTQEISYPVSDLLYSWIPPKCPSNRHEDYFEEIPTDMVPKLGSEGALNRLKGLSKQIPITDLSESHCRFVEPECQAELIAFVQNLKSKYLRFGSVKEWEPGLLLQCLRCLASFKNNELVVTLSVTRPQAFHIACFGKCWHLNCITCEKCDVVLLDLVEHEGKFYCIKCYDDDIAPRCKECDGLFEGHAKVIKYEVDIKVNMLVNQ
ncbi:prickle planar cell polarity protein 3-like [Parasteatoda tepidariorum]|uniref:prickle planar cell polarity protein 3-like n=1 Tax=Parasteatoda tepidariorum TaxID=114398 RepID=UPI0039BCAC8E